MAMTIPDDGLLVRITPVRDLPQSPFHGAHPPQAGGGPTVPEHPSPGTVLPGPPPGIWVRCFVPSIQQWESIYLTVGPEPQPQPQAGAPPPKGESGSSPAPGTTTVKAAGVNQPLSDRPPAP
jgi:hypothetical protein